MKKTLLINELLQNISELNKLGDGKSGALLIFGDADSETALSCVRGNGEVLATAFGSIMDDKPEVKGVLFSMFGAYLRLNPECKNDFLTGLQTADFKMN